MSDEEKTRIYLITPPALDLSGFSELLARALDAVDIACVRFTSASVDEGEILRQADNLREVCHAREVALVIDEHFQLVERLGLDGVHLGDGAKKLRYVREQLGQDAIVGAFCGSSRHAGLTAGEIGADYVSFGPVTASGLGDGSLAAQDLFEWWSSMIEVPVVAEGSLSLDQAETLAPFADFIALGAEIWNHGDSPVDMLLHYQERIS